MTTPVKLLETMMPNSILGGFDETPETLRKKVNDRKITWENGVLKSPDGSLLSSYSGNFVLDEKGDFYADLNKSTLCHVDILRGLPVVCAGECTIIEGKITDINNKSGHYKPPVHHFYGSLQVLHSWGVFSQEGEVEFLSFSDTKMVKKNSSLDKFLQEPMPLFEDPMASQRNPVLNQKLRDFCLNSPRASLDLSQTGLKNLNFHLIIYTLRDEYQKHPLPKIDLSGNPDLTHDTQDALAQLIKNFPSLKELDLRGTGASKQILEQIRKNDMREKWKSFFKRPLPRSQKEKSSLMQDMRNEKQAITSRLAEISILF